MYPLSSSGNRAGTGKAVTLAGLRREIGYRSGCGMAQNHRWQKPAERIADVAEKQRPHALVKIARLTTTNGENTHQVIVAQGHQGNRGNGLVPIRKQKFPLTLPELSTD